MRKIARPSTPAPSAPEVPRAPEVPPVDIDAILARQAEVLTKNTEAMVTAVREEMRGLTSMVVESRKGKVKVEIERDRNGRMSNLIIEKVSAPGRRLN